MVNFCYAETLGLARQGFTLMAYFQRGETEHQLTVTLGSSVCISNYLVHLLLNVCVCVCVFLFAEARCVAKEFHKSPGLFLLQFFPYFIVWFC